MRRWLNNTIYLIIAIVSMGCTMQGIKWQSKEKKQKISGKYSLY